MEESRAAFRLLAKTDLKTPHQHQLNHGVAVALDLQTPISLTTPIARMEGRMQASWKGSIGRDAERAPLGHGWPVGAGPFHDVCMREPRRAGA